MKPIRRISFLKCPNSGAYFPPKRSNQFFRTTKDGEIFRNNVKSLGEQYKWKKDAAFINLKILIRLFKMRKTLISRDEFDLLCMESDGFESISCPLRNEIPPLNMKWYEVYGFWIRVGRKFVFIIPPEVSMFYPKSARYF